MERVIRAIENASWLDRPAGAGTSALTKALVPGPVKSALSGTWLGHPVHPVLVTVPLGAWVGASVLDATGGLAGRGAARTLIGFGSLAALPSAVTGASDWADTLGPERRVGFVHAVANYTALGVYAASWRARGRGSHGVGVALAVLGAGVVGFGGLLGGHLAYARGIGVDTTAFMGGPTAWTDVAAESDLVDGTPIGVTAAGVPVMIVRLGTALFAMNDRCTHRGAPLHEGSVVADCIECPWHGSRFRIDGGDVVRGPATRPQPTFEVRATGGRLQVRQVDEQGSLRTNPVATGTA